MNGNVNQKNMQIWNQNGKKVNRVYEPTSIMAYELDIMAMSRFNKTITLITLYEPNMSKPQNRVYDLIPSNSKFSNPTIPKLAQNSDCDDSNRLWRQVKWWERKNKHHRHRNMVAFATINAVQSFEIYAVGYIFFITNAMLIAQSFCTLYANDVHFHKKCYCVIKLVVSEKKNWMVCFTLSNSDCKSKYNEINTTFTICI